MLISLFLPLGLLIWWQGVSTAVAQPAAALDISLELVADGFTRPLGVRHSGVAGDERLFVLEQEGLIKILLPDGTVLLQPFLDISDKITFSSERGLLGMAFHPDFAQNGYFYLNYSRRVDGEPEDEEDKNGDTVIARFQVNPNNKNLADPNSETVIWVVDQDFANHNGGDLVFGPDGYLYITFGDGGSGNDPNNRAQDLSNVLGSLARILPEPYPDDLILPSGPVATCGRPEEPHRYYIPEDNPFYDAAGANGCSEIWAYGLRNPWRISFDRATDDLYIADVGQNAWEEVNFQAAASNGGENYGWRCYEGLHENFPCANGLDQVEPFFEYSHSLGSSVTGGYVYRGTTHPAMVGHYFFGDFGSGRMWTAISTGAGWDVAEEGVFNGRNFSSFGEDEYGELYVVNYGGEVYRVREAYGAQLTAVGPEYVVGDELITYTLTARNMGTEPLTDVVISNTLPAGANHISGGTLVGDTVQWSVGTLAPDAEMTVQFTVSATQTVVNDTYVVSANEIPPIPGRVSVTTMYWAQLLRLYVPLVTRP